MQTPNREADDRGVLDQQVIGFSERRPPAGKSDNQDPSEGRDATHGLIEHVAANGVIDDVCASSARQFRDLGAETVARLASGVEAFRAAPKLARRLGAENRIHVARHYSFERMLELYRERYEVAVS